MSIRVTAGPQVASVDGRTISAQITIDREYHQDDPSGEHGRFSRVSAPWGVVAVLDPEQGLWSGFRFYRHLRWMLERIVPEVGVHAVLADLDSEWATPDACAKALERELNRTDR